MLPKLDEYIFVNQYGTTTIDFSDPQAVKALNTALLYKYYGIQYWDIPKGYLCPGIPNRADYVHYAADLLKPLKGKAKHNPLRVLDIGTGASCIYAILGASIYNWHVLAVDIDEKALKNAHAILEKNNQLKDKIQLTLQPYPSKIFQGIIQPEDRFQLAICNPPFHSSAEEVQAASKRKMRNLHGKDAKNKTSNFAGTSSELFCKGGEVKFINKMILESKIYQDNCKWFTTLVSKKEHLKLIMRALKRQNPADIKIVDMAQGNKKSRFLAWTFKG